MNCYWEDWKHELSYRKAGSMYGIPWSTGHNHIVGVFQQPKGTCNCANPCRRKYACSVVTTHTADRYCIWPYMRIVVLDWILNRNGHDNPFRDNCSGKDGGMLSYIDILNFPFDCQNPYKWPRPPHALTRSDMRSVNSSSCMPFTINLVGWNTDESGFPLCPRTSQAVTTYVKQETCL